MNKLMNEALHHYYQDMKNTWSHHWMNIMKKEKKTPPPLTNYEWMRECSCFVVVISLNNTTK